MGAQSTRLPGLLKAQLRPKRIFREKEKQTKTPDQGKELAVPTGFEPAFPA